MWVKYAEAPDVCTKLNRHMAITGSIVGEYLQVGTIRDLPSPQIHCAHTQDNPAAYGVHWDPGYTSVKAGRRFSRGGGGGRPT